ncbi:hypothetical protein [Pseudonocardia sp. WMMC193]|uniref:hypothetical protein n=1 Tax=Pseudonocardia sp. WMMC193 TaxID=2911965 RepID=UPI001F292A21|nr:hypothetical protein [Pseudonocardia sp. WMMC193]MCF7551000.1 hypothetical protein [Pseudonocardia sp. WMMC193]
MTGEQITRAAFVGVGALLIGWLAWLARPRPYNINGGLPRGITAPIGVLLGIALVVLGSTGWMS